MSQQQNITKTKTSDGLEFRDNNDNSVYLCTNDHRGNAGSTKSMWCVSEDQEYEVYSDSRSRDQSCSSGHLWGFGNFEGTEILGTRGEVVAKFTGPAWHGYPIMCKDTRPPKELVKKLRDDLKVISEQFALRIMTQKV